MLMIKSGDWRAIATELNLFGISHVHCVVRIRVPRTQHQTICKMIRRTYSL